MGGLHKPLFVALPVFVLCCGSFVVLFFTFAERDFYFDLIVFPIHGQGNARVAPLLGGDEDLCQFASMQEKFA